jgi:hypothetical protein
VDDQLTAYEHPVGNGAIYAFTDWYYRSKIDFFLYKSVEFSDDKLLEGGLRIGYRTDRYDFAGFVRNITNESRRFGIDFNNLTAMVNEPSGASSGRQVQELPVARAAGALRSRRLLVPRR